MSLRAVSDRVESQVYGAAWRRVRKLVLERDGYLCQIKGRHCTIDATCVDHIVPWRAGGAFYDPANLRASCDWCNNARVWREKKSRPSREW